jgi:hypothetical protein
VSVLESASVGVLYIAMYWTCIGRCVDNSRGNRSEQSPALEIKQRVCAVCSALPFTDGRGRHERGGKQRWDSGNAQGRTFVHGEARAQARGGLFQRVFRRLAGSVGGAGTSNKKVSVGRDVYIRDWCE